MDFRNDVNWNKWSLLWNDHLSRFNYAETSRWQQPFSGSARTLGDRFERVPEGSQWRRYELGYGGNDHLERWRIDQGWQLLEVDRRAQLTRTMATPGRTDEQIQVSGSWKNDNELARSIVII